MEISRRSILGAGAVVGAGVLLPLKPATAANAALPQHFEAHERPWHPSPLVEPFTESLPTLSEMGVIDATRGRSAKITMVRATTHEFRSGTPVPTFAYRAEGGTQDYLGPVIIARRNVRFKLTVVNDLDDHPLADSIDMAVMGAVPGDIEAPRSALHLHGGNTAAAFDGDPLDFFPNPERKDFKDDTHTYTYENTQEAAGLWYHDHALGITRLNVAAGLAGGYLIRDENDPGDGSRLPAPPYEVPLIVQDRAFNADGTMFYPPAPWEPEFFGDQATVNGKIQPNLDVNRGKYRFRVLNGSNARFYNFRFECGGRTLKFLQIGTDGGLLDSPVSLRSLLLAPGERADLVVDFGHLRPNTHVVLTNDAPAPFPFGDEVILDKIMQFTVTRATGWTKSLTPRTSLRSRTAPITRLEHLKVDKTRNMSLVEVQGDDGPLMVLMNNQTFDHTIMDPHMVKSNALEEWVIINTTGDAHPMHLHFAQFQIMSRQEFDSDQYALDMGYVDDDGNSIGPAENGSFPPPVDVTDYLVDGSRRRPDANEMGWKDVVVTLPGEVTRIRIPFGPQAVPNRWPRRGYLPMAIGAAHKGDYVSHCHILEHEENDMMMRFTIE